MIHTVTVKPYTSEQGERWDDFVMRRSANGTFLQTRRFLGYHPDGRFKDDSRMLYINQELVAVCPAADCVRDGKRMFRSHPGSTFGGLVVAPAEQRAPKLIELVLALDEQLKADGYQAAELKPTPAVFSREPDEAIDYALYHEGYEQELEIACVLPLNADIDTLKKAYSYNKRYDLKKAEKHALTAAPLTTDDEVREFHALLCLNLRKFDTEPVHTVDELLELKNTRLRDEMSFLGVRDAKGALVAGACLFYFEQVNVLHTQYLATDTGITDYVPSTFLYDSVIRAAASRGCAALSLGTCTHERGHVLNVGLILNKEGYGAGHSVNRIFTRHNL